MDVCDNQPFQQKVLNMVILKEIRISVIVNFPAHLTDLTT